MKPRIVYQDDAIIVVYKPAGLATQTARVGQVDLVSELKKETGSRYLGVVHRLDQPVEGLLVFGRNQKASAGLSAQLSGGGLHKHYFAAICGQPACKSAELVDYLVKERDNHALIVTGQEHSCADAKKAVLRYQILETISTPAELSLADIHIETGRFHQIRAQMAHAGFPLLADKKYGNQESIALAEKLGLRNVSLCAYRLAFVHPVTHRKMSFEIKPENRAFDFFLENNFGCDCLY